MKTYTTQNGKEINIVRDKQTPHLKIQFASGGQLPEELSGIYTSESFAEEAVQGYISRQESISKSKKTKEK